MQQDIKLHGCLFKLQSNTNGWSRQREDFLHHLSRNLLAWGHAIESQKCQSHISTNGEQDIQGGGKMSHWSLHQRHPGQVTKARRSCRCFKPFFKILWEYNIKLNPKNAPLEWSRKILKFYDDFTMNWDQLRENRMPSSRRKNQRAWETFKSWMVG